MRSTLSVFHSIGCRFFQVFTSIAYGSKGHDFPLLGVSTMAMGRARFVALDLQPLFAGDAYTAKYSEVYSRMKAIRNKYPQMGQVTALARSFRSVVVQAFAPAGSVPL